MAYRYNEKTGEFEDLGNSRRERDACDKPTVETKKDNSGWILAVVVIFAINFLAQLLTAFQQG
mgnify:CR=1 FL=1